MRPVDRLIDYVSEKLPAVAEHIEQAREGILALTMFPQDVRMRIWSNNPSERLNRHGPKAAPTSGSRSSSQAGSLSSHTPATR